MAVRRWWLGAKRQRGHMARTPRRNPHAVTTTASLRRAAFERGLVAWTEKPTYAQTTQHVSGLRGTDRMSTLRNAALDGLVRYYHQNPNADVAPGIVALVAALSDNDDYGAFYMAVPTIAAALSRSERRVTDALGRLVENGIVLVRTRRGAASTYSLSLAPAVVADANAPAVWVVAAYAAEPLTPASPLTPVTRTTDAGVTEPLTPASGNITIKTSQTRSDGAHARNVRVDDSDKQSEQIPRGWRVTELEWLVAAMPREPLDGLVRWLWGLQFRYGGQALDVVLENVRSPVESGNVPNVKRYIEGCFSTPTQRAAAAAGATP